MARQVVSALDSLSLAVFPNVRTSWHFDDKVAQKYLLEAINAPLIPTWVFTRQSDAVRWVEENQKWPKVFKLRCGAGGNNVRLVHSKKDAIALCRRAFGRGFPAVAGYLADVRTKLRNVETAQELVRKLARAPRSILSLLAIRHQLPRERGYVYFQEFLASNELDTRITVIGDRAFGFLRANRPNDFRASGSGAVIYEPSRIDSRCVSLAFEVAKQIGAQSLAFDFLFSDSGRPMIGEISYCYLPDPVHRCAGHWNSRLEWIEGGVWPQDAILDDLLTACSL